MTYLKMRKILFIGVILLTTLTMTGLVSPHKAHAAPAAPTNLTATAVSFNTINLNWTDNSTDEYGFTIQRALISTGPFTTVKGVGPNITSWSDTNLATETTYYYRIYAENWSGSSSYSNVASATTLTTVYLGAPSNLMAITISSHEIDLYWNDNSGIESGFKVERATDPAGIFMQIGDTLDNITRYSDRSVESNTSYYYRVVAYDSISQSYYSNTASATTLLGAPIAPTALSSVSTSLNQINLVWADNSSDETGFKVERASAKTGSWNQVGTVANNITAFSDTGLTANTAYYYRVAAYNAIGNSAYSNITDTVTRATLSPLPNPSVLGFISDIGSVNDVVVSSTNPNIVYLASSPFGLVIVDVSDKAKPKILNDYASQHPAGPASQIAVSGNTAVAVGTPRGTDIVDISDVTYPKVVASIPGSSVDVAISGNYAYVASAGDVKVIDISNPASAYVATTLVTPDMAYGVVIKGNIAVVADAFAGLHVVDISTPLSPRILGSVALGGLAGKVSITTVDSKDYAIVANSGTASVQIVDISNPTDPNILKKVGEIVLGSVLNVDVFGSRVYVAANSYGVKVLDISTPSAPTVIGTYDPPDNWYNPRAVAVSGDYAFTAAGDLGLHIINIANFGNITLTGTVANASVSSQLAIDASKHIAVAVGSFRGTDIIDIADPTKPKILKSIPGSAVDVAISGNYAYVAAGDLKVIDISIPASAYVAATLVTPGIAYGVAIKGDIAVVADAFAGLHVVDIGVPLSPRILGSVALGGLAGKVSITTVDNKDYAVVANSGLASFQVIDISTPSAPIKKSDVVIGSILNLEAVGNKVYVAANQYGMKIYDISNPTSPSPLGTYDPPDNWFNPRAVTVSGNYAYISAGDLGVYAVDISIPQNPALVNTAASVGGVNDIVVVADKIAGDKLYISDTKAELAIMDVYHDGLKVTKDVSSRTAASKDVLTYTLTIKNTSPNTVHNLTLKDPVPVLHAAYVDRSADNGGRIVTAADGKKYVQWDTSMPELKTILTDFPPGTELAVTYKVQVN